ncbi:MAG: MBL fold metallo-hydrolase [Oscillospiraceae bacterium]|nr:MBL fold metallo-hydrolase [Oscillospiraceae bacterium]
MKIITSTEKPKSNINYICMYTGGSPVTCYVIKGRNGDMLIDTGFFHTYPHLLDWLSNYNIRHIFLTHAHVDHDYNAAKIRKELNAEIILGQHDLPLIGHYGRQPVKATSDKYRLRNIQQNICGRMKIFSTKPYRPDILVTSDNRSILRELGYNADVIPLAGHTLGSMGILSDNVLYCGDAFTAIWGKPDITPHAVSIKLMERSLKRILKLSPEWLATGHGIPQSMTSSRPVINEYLAERSRT